MIHEIMSKGTSFEHRVNYIFNLTKSVERQQQVEYIGGTLFAGNPITRGADGQIAGVDVKPVIDEFQNQASKYIPRTGSDPKLVFHSAISLAPGESLTRSQWRKLGKAYMAALGFDDGQWLQVKHADSDLEHCHFVANRTVESKVKEGKYRLVSDSMDRDKGMSVMREFEKEFDITITADPEFTDEISYTQREVIEATKTGKLPWRKQVLDNVLAARDASKGKSWSHFIKACEAMGVGVNTRISDAGQCVGVSYEYGGKVISGRKLKAAACTFQKLTKTGGINHVNTSNEIQAIEDANSRFEGRQNKTDKALDAPRSGTEKAFEDSIAIEGEVILTSEKEVEQAPFIPVSVHEISVDVRVMYLVRFHFFVPTSTPALKKEKQIAKKIFDGKYTGDISNNDRYSALDLTQQLLKGAFGDKPVSTRYVEYTTGEANIITLSKSDQSPPPAEFGSVREHLGGTMHSNGLGYKQGNIDILAAKNLLGRGWNKSNLVAHIAESKSYNKMSAELLVTKAMLSRIGSKKDASHNVNGLINDF